MKEGDVSFGRVDSVGSFEEDFLPVDDDRAEVNAEAFSFCERLQIYQEGVDAPRVLSWRKSFPLVKAHPSFRRRLGKAVPNPNTECAVPINGL